MAVAKKAKRVSDAAYADTPFVRYLATQFDAVSNMGTRKIDIARQLGYATPNIISMFKYGHMKVPLTKIPALAKALNVDPAFLFRLGMQQYWDADDAETIAAVFGTICSKNEVAILEVIRKATDNTDPALTRDTERKLKAVFS